MGIPWLDGLIGPTGPAGTNGTNGTNGATGATGATGTNGTNGTNGATGATGPAGADAGWPYRFSTTTTAADPGSGFIRADNVDFSLATALYISETTSSSLGIARVISAWDDSTTTAGRAILTIQGVTDPTKFVSFLINGANVDNTGWQILSVAWLDGDTSLVNGDHYRVEVARTGNTGPSGSNGTNGTNGTNGATGATGAAGSPFGWGDGSDGALDVTSGTTTLTRDSYYTTLTVRNGATLRTAGFRVFASTSITVESGGVIEHVATAGFAAGSSGAGAVSGTLAAGAAGGTGGTTTGNAGTALTAAIGGTGGAGGAGSGGAGGTGGTITAPTAANGGYRNAVGAMLCAAFGGATWTSLRPGAGGGSGGGDGTSGSGGGGGGGAMMLASPTIQNDGTIRCNGAAGGSATSGNRGGGGGGGGGFLSTIARTYSGSGAYQVNGGAGGSGFGTGTAGSAGNTGTHLQITV